jgi:hypothetical protein
MHLGLKIGSLFQKAPVISFLISSGPKKKERRYVCVSEAKASHSHKMWTEVSSSAPHFLQVGLLLSPITYTCLVKVSYPVKRPITTLDYVLLKDNNRAINQFSSLSPCTTRPTPQYQMLVFHPAGLDITFTSSVGYPNTLPVSSNTISLSHHYRHCRFLELSN